MNNTKSIINRMKELFKVKNNKLLSQKIGVPYETLNTWIKRDTLPFDVIENVVQNEHISYDWLLTGEKPKSEDDNHTYTVPKLSIEASAGSGIENFTIEEVGKVLLDKELFRYAMNPKSLKIIQVKGDSMQPTIMDESHVVIDESQTEKVDAIYAICLGGQVMVKRLQYNLDGTVSILSDNPNYETKLYDPKESQIYLRVLGKKVLVIQ